ncbi:hypothetical protein A5787_13300 [Mycobacterium sp. 852002-50816_SCH5313054-b]|uniref:hypothetical protein n=1 Tax=Mycobacterium sp. 852002-50816_SCH5313054-b TaxID=1834092 RepID=UPI0007FB94DD|nr:hypothetical protein [Mycobacterium sp. 852002-50816_SCH5313054-b]OBF44767.1 hypothetical protein A5787_13300 [Mycobacterium sp. 852002-50816_SCH5313054-b]
MIVWARVGYGIALLAIPSPLLRLVTNQPATARERAVTRILGARLLAQAAVTDVRPDAVSVALGAEVDFVHAITMLGWAAVDRGARRLTLFSAATAGLFAVAGAAQARRAPAVADAPTGDALATLVRLRHRAAETVARYTLPGFVRAGLKT